MTRVNHPQAEHEATPSMRVLRQDRPQGAGRGCKADQSATTTHRPQGERLAAYPLRVLRRDGAPLAISLVLHLLALLLIAPWLVMRTIPTQQIEVEVMLEPDASQPARSTPRTASRLRAPEKLPNLLAKPAILPMPPRTVPVRPINTEQLAQPSQTPAAQPGQTPSTQPGQGQSGQSAPASREAASLSAPSAARSAAVPRSVGSTALERGPSMASAAAPRLPSLDSAPQPSSRTAASPSRPGNDRQDGLVTLDGPASPMLSRQPEFRQAARQGGQVSIRGGSQAPDEGLARQAGTPDQTAMLAARAVPSSPSGSSASRGGVAPQVAVPVARLSGQGGVVAAETSSAGLVQSDAPAAGAEAAVASRTPSISGRGNTAAATTSSSRSVSPAERGAGLVAAATPGTGSEAAVASRAPASGGQGRTSADTGASGRAVSPAEHGSGLLAAAAPSPASGPGAAAPGAGSGAGLTGEGRAQPQGGGSAGRDAPATLLAAAGGSLMAAPVAIEGGSGQLSGRTEAPVQTAREARSVPLQTQKPNGQARVIEERFTAQALKVDSPRSICEIPLMFAGFDRKPIPKGLDTINAIGASLPGETPPRHHPGNEAPRYPMQALGSRAEGRALVRAEIRPDGQVGKLWIKQSSGVAALDQAALETVRSWHFYPAKRHGMAVAMWLDVPIEYKLPKE